MTGPVVVTVLIAAALLSGVSIGGAHASNGSPQIASVNSVPRPTAVTFPAHNESVVVGTSEVVSIDGASVSPPGVFAISFAGLNFSGAQFELYMSADGFAQIGNSDVRYGPTFNVADFSNATDAWKQVDGSIGPGLTGTFYIGTTESDIPMVAGPIAMNISNAYDFIKIFQGSSSSVVVVGGSTGTRTLNTFINIQLSSSSGAPGTPVTVTGGGFPAGTAVDINATYETAPWIGSNETHNFTWISGINTENGYFTTGATSMVDTGQVINPQAAGPYTTVPILLFAVNASDPSQVLNAGQKGLGSPVFREFSRGIDSVTSYSSSGQPVDTSDGAYTPGYLYGNGSGTTGPVGPTMVIDMPPVYVQVLGALYIAGSYFDVGQPVTFWVGPSPSDAVEMNTSAPVTPNSTGFWNATVTVPPLTGGPHTVWVENDGVDYTVSNDAPGTITTTTTTTATTTTSSASSTTSSALSTSTTTQSSTTANHATSARSASTGSTSTTAPTSSEASPGAPVGPEYLAVGVTAVVLLLVVSFVFFRGKRPSNG